MRCFLCRQNNFKTVYRLKNKNILCCLNDSLYLSQTTSADKHPSYTKNYYANSPHPKFLNLNQSYFQSKLNNIIKLTGIKKPVILDVGCGWGNFLEVLKDNNLPYLGIDTAKEAVTICQKKGLNCQNISLETLVKKSEKKYDAVACFQAIEHINNPLPFLSSIKKILKTNGILILTTPNNNSPLRKIFRSRWSVYNTDSHLVFYNKQSLTQTLTVAGFKNIKVRTDVLRFLSLGYILSRLFNFNLGLIKKLSIPVPTDLWGDLEAVAFNP